MNALPEHRRVLYGRTHCRIYDPSEYDPIQFVPRGGSVLERVAGYALAIAVAVGLGWWLAMWATS